MSQSDPGPESKQRHASTADDPVPRNSPRQSSANRGPELDRDPEEAADPASELASDPSDDPDPDADLDPGELSPEDPAWDDDAPQPPDRSRVDKGMASAAWNATAGHLPGAPSGTGSETRSGQADTTSNAYIGSDGEQTDAAIMLRVREGDQAAFTYLIGKYQRQIVHFMYRMVHNQAVAEELAQEVFLRVYRSRESYRAEAKFTTWLYRIATNLGVNHARDNKHERAAQNVYLDQPDAETGSTPDVADSRATIEQTMLRDERMQAIRQHVMALPERQRSAVLMHKYQEMDYKQIGEVLKLSESATKSLLFRAYQTLRERLKEYV